MTGGLIFNSTILVLWAVLIVPFSIKENKNWIILLSGVVLIPIEVFIYTGIHEYPFNVIRGFLLFLFALSGGYLMHYYNQKNEKE